VCYSGILFLELIMLGRRNLIIKVVWLLSASLALTPLLGAVVKVAPATHKVGWTPSPSVLPSSQVLSDFDGDHKVDTAELSSIGSIRNITVRLGKSTWKSLVFDSGVTSRGQLFSGDIDSDGDIDLIWLSEESPRKVVIWLGDGQGDFSMAPSSGEEYRKAQTTITDSSKTGLANGGNDSGVTYVPPTLSFAGTPVLAASGLYLVLSKGFLPLTRAPALAIPFLTVLQKRGPPPQSL
jgi:hypothetical protein